MTPRLGGPSARILCPDERLSRLLENELGLLGVVSAPWDGVSPLPEGVNLILWDCDAAPLPEGPTSLPADASLLAFGRASAANFAANFAASFAGDKHLFLRRPFGLTELEQALRALLSDVPLQGLPTLPPPTPVRRAAPQKLAAKDGVITLGDLSVTLTPAEWDIFRYLYDRAGEAVPRHELAALLEGGGNSTDVYVCRLRTKIEKPLGRRLIHTVRGVGYRFEE